MTDAANSTAVATIALFLGMQGDKLKAFTDRETAVADLGGETALYTTAAELADTNDVPLAAIVNAYNQVAGSKNKVRGFKDRAAGSTALFGVLEDMVRKQQQSEGQSETEKLAAAVKNEKPKKEKKEKAAGTGEGRSSPLAKKFWSRSGNAIKGRRLGGTGVGINALQYIIKNPGVSTEDYLANSGGGRFVDLQYDLDYGNIVELKGATPEERQAEIEALAEQRKAAEAAEAEKQAKAEADKKAKAEKAEADKKAKQEAKAKADAEKKAAADAKAKADAEAAAKPEGETAPAEGEQAPATEGATA